MKKIKVQFVKGKKSKSKGFWVKERNPFFSWYKDNPRYKTLKEVEE